MATPDSIAGFLLKSVNRAVRDFGLMVDGDRIAVGVSGGKDSRTLIDLLNRGVDIPGTYDVVAVHIDGTGVGLPDQTAWLEAWFCELGVEYLIQPLKIAEGEPLPMNCFRCARSRRKALFFAAEALGCNKVALGHHADDAAVTTLMSMMYKGQVETLLPRRDFFQGRFQLIRPLIYVNEVEIRRYARACGWTFPPELACPRERSARRVQIEQFLAALPRRERGQIRANLWRAGRQSHQTRDSEPTA